eukprot:5487635-Alexandrium_andersonii.AAC.1
MVMPRHDSNECKNWAVAQNNYGDQDEHSHPDQEQWRLHHHPNQRLSILLKHCLLYTSDAADDM